MVIVRVHQGAAIRSALPTGPASNLILGATAGLAAPLLGGCSLPAETMPAEEALGTVQAALTPNVAGTAVLQVSRWFGSPGPEYHLVVKTSSTDEYLRAGQTLSITAPAYDVWFRLHPQDVLPTDVDRLKALRLEARVSFFRDNQEQTSVGLRSVPPGAAGAWDVELSTDSFVVPTDVDTLKVTLVLSDAVDPEASVTLTSEDVASLPVFGGHLPNKNVVFDNFGRTLRTRILEGGSLGAGTEVTVAYTDWRADAVVVASAIDREIGRAKGFGRFGQYEMPIYGDLVHEVTMGHAVDQGAFQPEMALVQKNDSVFVPSPRSSYETRLAVPAGAKKVSVYFHIKTFLVADYSKWQNVTQRRYGDCQRILVRERWDNPRGPFTNYELTTAAP